MTRVYVDLGANTGRTLSRELDKCSYDVIWAFEPNPELGVYLRNKFPEHVNIVEAAAWNCNGITKLYLGNPLSSTIILGKKSLEGYPEFHITYDQFVFVETVDFSKWILGNVPDGVDLVVKMDIEGAEYEVLKRLLDTGVIERISELRCEFHGNRFPYYSDVHNSIYDAVGSKTKLVPWK